MIDLTPVIQAAISLAVALITVFVIPLIRSNIASAKRSEILAWVNIAVSAAEQIIGSGNGSEKKDYVVRFLEGKGFSLDIEEINNMIEAAVYEITKDI